MIISDWLHAATVQLQSAGIDSARLDAEIILAHTIHRPRTYLHAHGDEQLDSRRHEIANARLALRRDFTPIAYIIGHKEFYGRPFKVTTATLIPRPESETMITLLKEHVSQLARTKNIKHLIDVGTGSGCLGITAKLELPRLDVTVSDISRHALAVAQYNANKLGASVHFFHGNLLHGYGLPVDIILANLPYVDRAWEVSRETHAEPDIALYATDSGLALIKALLAQASQLLPKGGQLYLEADPRQHTAIIELGATQGFKHIQSPGFIIVLRRA